LVFRLETEWHLCGLELEGRTLIGDVLASDQCLCFNRYLCLPDCIPCYFLRVQKRPIRRLPDQNSRRRYRKISPEISDGPAKPGTYARLGPNH
jgi:hypothetical protein